MDQGAIAALLGKIDQEVFVLTAADGDRRNGQIVVWVMPASIIPQFPGVVVGVGQMTYTCELIQASRKFALNMLGVDQWQWVPHFGFQSGRDTDKFSTIGFKRGITGSPLLPGTVGYVECEVRAVLDARAHFFYLADVLEGKLVSDREPLRFQQLLRLLPPEDLATMRRLLEEDRARDLSLLGLR
ncbi:MAG: flavin reductase family protein [candidate division NC10 bacterium]